jgi:hypothetical protein
MDAFITFPALKVRKTPTRYPQMALTMKLILFFLIGAVTALLLLYAFQV